MLVLTREIGETFNIGDEITVKVLGISGNQVRLGINAPRSIRIHRAEVIRRIASRLQNLANRSPGR
ncbi:carbon storage regulator CsrA [Pseudomonas graminis]|uniref:Translational regulator CsrA n=1 Tax=Pseudomonas graminis TaxID=158627 RepID=A0A1I0FK65_9PSED|nr:carbon storage regulator CsrA [Pseudomonas graminis]SET57942.1 carbon storage regulator, CsrA [Pseudomonas graminis]